MKRFLLWLIRLTKPIVWRIAEAYDLKVDRPLHAYGQNPVILEDGPEKARGFIPKSVYFNTRSGSIYVGRNSCFGADVLLLTGKHMNIAEARAAGVPQHHVPESGRDIRIGRNCFIGSHAILIGPVVVGDNAIIGAGAVVTKDVPAGAFFAGKPATVIRMLE